MSHWLIVLYKYGFLALKVSREFKTQNVDCLMNQWWWFEQLTSKACVDWKSWIHLDGLLSFIRLKLRKIRSSGCSLDSLLDSWSSIHRLILFKGNQGWCIMRLKRSVVVPLWRNHGCLRSMHPDYLKLQRETIQVIQEFTLNIR